MAYIFQTRSCCCSYEHRHILYIESADKKESSFADGVGIGLHILDKDVAVYIGKKHVVCVSLEK
jgi:hypothetical protein